MKKLKLNFSQIIIMALLRMQLLSDFKGNATTTAIKEKKYHCSKDYKKNFILKVNSVFFPVYESEFEMNFCDKNFNIEKF